MSMSKTDKIKKFTVGDPKSVGIGETLQFFLDTPKSVIVSMEVTSTEDGTVTGRVWGVGAAKGSGWEEVFLACIGQQPQGTIEDGVFTISIDE